MPQILPVVEDCLRKLIEVTNPTLSRDQKIETARQFAIMVERWIRANEKNRAKVLKAEGVRLEKFLNRLLKQNKKKTKAAR
ncbi:MAG: hypothetical protein A2945_04905 [Candidatus Liptonbacteria bacterium RIFCSPLOWO2_01_FULL_52_25]|uniref:Uncharacterized protein n=1 Tax=Candidatus Liptonbacteria bacterium RIFCSPLOWO2_01_FULL_52_25 TaxID=1798650 RepID=A0A1G2CDK7_9BACT|nr:MAG: hypothetical protein A2945_04905 [Candidatus Liptonbacteria bacterium RIFCSPLOWO2_01_FULL_52_25]